MGWVTVSGRSAARSEGEALRTLTAAQLALGQVVEHDQAVEGDGDNGEVEGDEVQLLRLGDGG